MLNREVDDLEQWIADREVVAGSHELGQDYDHVTVSNTENYITQNDNFDKIYRLIVLFVEHNI